jgi:hypothetical protein
MEHGWIGNTRWPLKVAVTTVVACAMLAATASVALATSTYSAVITPVSAPAGATTIFNVALTNNTASNGINSAMITPSKGFTLVDATSPQGTTSVQPNKIIIRNLNLPLGSTVNVSVTATAPAQGGDPRDWKLQAFSNGPNSAGPMLDGATSSVTTPLTSPQTTSTDCPATGCSVSLSTPSTSFSLNVNSGSTGGTVTASVDTGTPMDGPGALNDPGCANYVPQSPDWYGFDVTDTSQSKNISWIVKNSDPNTFQVCFGAPYQFDVLNSDNNLVGAPAGTLPDGTSGFVGLLPPCPNEEIFARTNADITPAASEEGPVFICASISADESNPTTTDVSVFIPSGLDGDPYMGR